MSISKFIDEFKRDAVEQITEMGYPVREVGLISTTFQDESVLCAPPPLG